MEAAARWPADLVVSAIVGAVGLKPTFAAIQAGAGDRAGQQGDAGLRRRACHASGRALRRDFAAAGFRAQRDIFRRWPGRHISEVACMTVTASGGPFREWGAERIARATKAEALAHPKWSMGPKISVDSASLMNKGLELIEAHHLFGVAPEKLAVVVHPQSIVHGLIAFEDGSTLAGLANPDMRTAVAHCLAHPERVPSGVPRARPDRAVEADLRARRSRPLSRAAPRPRGFGPRAGGRRPRSMRPMRSRSRRFWTARSRSARWPTSSRRRWRRCAVRANWARRPTLRGRWRFTMPQEIGPPPTWRKVAPQAY